MDVFCITVTLYNRATGARRLLDGFNSVEALRKKYPISASGQDSAFADLPPGSTAEHWRLKFKRFLSDGEEHEIDDPRVAK